MAKNTLYYGDNLDILRRYIADESVDLVYLDPPFNSKATYNVLFREKDGTDAAAQIEAFDDFWHWDEAAAEAFFEVVEGDHAQAAEALRAFRQLLGDNDMLAYLAMMAPRLVELRRVLKSTGSIYLHCDPTASHYLKVLMDAVFGAASFRTEIIWKRTGAKGLAFTNYPKKGSRHYSDENLLACEWRPRLGGLAEVPGTGVSYAQHLQAGGDAGGDVWRRAGPFFTWDEAHRAREPVWAARPNRLHDTAAAAVESVCEHTWPQPTRPAQPGSGAPIRRITPWHS